jgi:hypothetical protein
LKPICAWHSVGGWSSLIRSPIRSYALLVFGVAFVAGLALTFQLSARPWLILVYGMLFGVTVWEVNFLAVLPVIAPALKGRLDLATQVWNGILSYCLVYGPTLATYVIRVRPGMLDQWWKVDENEAT